jgi:hypothetical protein
MAIRIAKRIAKWRRDTYWRWQDERQKRHAGGGSTPPGEGAPILQFNAAANNQLLVLLEEF